MHETYEKKEQKLDGNNSGGTRILAAGLERAPKKPKFNYAMYK